MAKQKTTTAIDPASKAKSITAQLSSKFSAAIDGFQNLVAKLGFGGDPQFSQGTYARLDITKRRDILESGYRTNWVIGQVVDCVADDMTRAGIQINSDDQPDDERALLNEWQNLGIQAQLNRLAKWGRLYGGAIAVIIIDGQLPIMPLNVNTVGRGAFSGLKVFDRWQLQPDWTQLVSSGPDAGLPMFYKVVYSADSFNIAGSSIQVDTSRLIMAGQSIHYSRIIRYTGIELPFYQSLNEWLWGESVIERCYDRILVFDTATAGAASLVGKAHLRTIRVENLREILAAGGIMEENLVKMFGYISLMQSSAGITLLDKNDEFQTDSYTFAGLPEALTQFGQQLSGATGIPLTRLFGQAPKGLNATGENDIRNYYDMISAQQENRLRPGCHKLLEVIYKSKFGRLMPDTISFSFKSLWQTSDSEKMVNVKALADSLSALEASGILDRATCLKELKQYAGLSGIFTNITKELITDAENEPPEAPELVPVVKKGLPGQQVQAKDVEQKAA